MRFFGGIAFAALTLVASNAQAESKEEKLKKKIAAITPETVLQSATLKDDAFENFATITTFNAFQEKRGLLGIVPFDNYFRAFVDKKSGVTKYQVYITSNYMGSSWANWSTVNYETPDGPKSVDLNVLSRDVGSCSKYMGCSYSEVVTFDVDEALLKTAAAAYNPAVISAWRFKIKGQSGVERVEGFLGAEVVGILKAVEAYKKAHNLPA